jgi:hypothetical protein
VPFILPARTLGNPLPRAASVALLALCLLSQSDAEAAKRRAAPRPEPDLRIISVTTSHSSYSPQEGPLDFSIEVALPKELDGATILEVSSLITSPSKRSLRFLSSRQPVSADVSTGPLRMGITLTWDGTDQGRQPVESGKYHYEVRAKLLAVSEKGARTQMVSWPKRGTIDVK